MSFRQQKRKELTDYGLAVNRGESVLHLTPNQALRASVFRVREERGGKAMADDVEVHHTLISKWESGNRRVPWSVLPYLVANDPLLGRYLLQMIPIWMGLPERAIQTLDPKEADRVRDAFERVVISEVSPGRWVR